MSLITPTTREASRAEASPFSRACLPPDFNAGAHPIIAAHWFGVLPDSPMGKAAVVAGMRHEIPIEHITWLRPRAFRTALALAGPGSAA